MSLRVLDLFSGVGAFSLGLERAGMKTVAFCENDQFCRRVLAKHWPETPILEDVTSCNFPDADVVAGGFPCQDISSAGGRAGLSGARSGLYRELVRGIRLVRPLYAVVENVADLLGRGMGVVLGDLAQSGCGRWIEWDCVPACALGAPHERDRVWIVAHADRQHRRAGTARKDWSEIGGDSEVGVAHASNPTSEPVGFGGQPRQTPSVECRPSNAESVGCRPGRPGRPPDSFARIRDEARRNAADPYGARLAFREGVTRDAWEERASAQRDGGSDVRQSIWPDEPALSGVDDEIADWMDRIKATGNTLDPAIPELIGRSIMDYEIGGSDVAHETGDVCRNKDASSDAQCA